MNLSPKSDYKIRFNDCDLFGHLNNARYIDYFMNAREDHLKDHYGLDLTSYYKNGLAWVVTQHEIHYLRPAIYNEMVTIETTLLAATSDELIVEMIMTNKDQNHVKSILHTTFTPIHPQTGKREKHPSEFMEWVKTIENPVGRNPIKERITQVLQELKEK